MTEEMSIDIKRQFDNTLASKFEALHLRRMSIGLYVQSESGDIWQGVLVAFNMKKGTLVAQPNLAVFCPSVDSVLAEYFRNVQSNNRYLSGFGKLGVPILICPLYDLVNHRQSNLRSPFSYSVETVGQVEEKAHLLAEDFIKVRGNFFLTSDSFEELRNRLRVDSSTGARMREIIVCYHLLRKRISSEEVDRIVGSNSNEMTRKFSEYFKSRFADEPA